MARIVARNAGVVVDGRNVSGRSNNVALSFTVEAPEVTSFNESTRTRVPGGLGDSEMTIDGFYDESASSVDELYSSLLAASGLWGFFPAGLSASGRGREFTGIISEYTPTVAVADAATTSVTVSTCQPFLYTRILSACMLEGSGASAAVGSVDFSASVSGQVYGILRYLSGAGASPTIAASLQDSADDSTWTTLMVFSSLSIGNTKDTQTSTSAARYRRLKYIVTSGSADVICSCGSTLM